LTSDPIFGTGEPVESHDMADGRKIVQYPDPEEQGFDEDIKVTQHNIHSSQKYWGHTWNYNMSMDMPNFAIPGKKNYDGENKTNTKDNGKWPGKGSAPAEKTIKKEFDINAIKIDQKKALLEPPVVTVQQDLKEKVVATPVAPVAPVKAAAPAAPAAAVAQTVAAPVAPVAPVAAPVLAASTGNKTQGKLATVTILSRAQMKEQL
jgi:hypothetical protein